MMRTLSADRLRIAEWCLLAVVTVLGVAFFVLCFERWAGDWLISSEDAFDTGAFVMFWEELLMIVAAIAGSISLIASGTPALVLKAAIGALGLLMIWAFVATLVELTGPARDYDPDYLGYTLRPESYLDDMLWPAGASLVVFAVYVLAMLSWAALGIVTRTGAGMRRTSLQMTGA